MPQVDLTVTISVILGCAAVIAPVLQTILHNHHENFIRKQDRKEQHYKESVLYRRKVLESYLQNASIYVHTRDFEKIAAYSESYSLAYLYATPELREQMENLDIMIAEHKYDEFYFAFKELHTNITAVLQTM